MSEYNHVDFEMIEEEEDAYDGPDAYLDEGDSVLELEDQESLRERRGGSRESTSFNQILLCKSLRCSTCSAYAQLICIALFDLQSVHQSSSGGEASGRPQPRIAAIEALRSLRLLNPASMESLEDNEYVDDDNDDDGDEFGQTVGDWHQQWFPPHKEPQKPGVELLMGGEFGCVSPKIRSRKNKKNVSRLMLNQSSRPRGAMHREIITNVCYPIKFHRMN